MQKNLIIISILALTLLTAACTPHRIDIQQGNKVDPEIYAKVKIGMTRNQVVFLLGTPLLKDPFHINRWDYLYYLKPGNNPVKQSRITLFFDGDSLVKIDSSHYTPKVHDNKLNDDFDPSDPAPSGGSGGGGGHSH